MFNNKKILAFLPAKTGSVGLPGKLFKKIKGYNLIEWTLYAAYKSNYIDEIVVSSNDPEIEKIVNEFVCTLGFISDKKLKFIKRPDELCTAISKTEDAISHLFDSYDSYTEYDYLIMLQATSPIRKINLIDEAILSLEKSNKNSLLTVSLHTPFFFKQKEEKDNNCCVINTKTEVLFDAKNRKMRQELQTNELMLHDDGCLYIFKVDMFLQERCRFDSNPILLFNDKISSLQIDDEIDFNVIKTIMERYQTDIEYIHNIVI